KIKKNHLNGKKRTVEIPIYHSTGIDDIGSCIDYLIEWKHWTKAGAKINAPEFAFRGTKEGLIREIEDADAEPQLRKIVQQVWSEVEEKSKVRRKKRYL